jgi:uncharacterized protein YbaR (Trm112 family)
MPQTTPGGRVSVDPRLLEILACPACHGEIAETEAEDGLRCAGCGRVYPIRDGIPVMLVEEASAPSRPDDRS